MAKKKPTLKKKTGAEKAAVKSVHIVGPRGREGTTATEAEWLASEDLRLMLWIVEPWVTDEDVSDRKLRLFACARARRVWHLLTDETRQHTVELAERYADGEATEEEMEARRRATFPRRDEQDRPGEPSVARCCLMDGYLSGDGGTYYYLMDILGELKKHPAQPGGAGEWADECALLCDIIGNPFRWTPRGGVFRVQPTVAFDPAWRTAHTVGIASKMYEERDFAAMPILADALEDAGCDNADILSHCREPVAHVRGCWVVDLVLAREEHQSGKSQE
jgi:hypothetical protein